MKFQGALVVYRIYDIGNEVDLSVASEQLTRLGVSEKFKLKRTTRSMVIEDAPVVINMGSWELKLGQSVHSVQGTAKLYNFGALSIGLRLDIPKSISANELCELANIFETDETIDQVCLDKVALIITELGRSLKDAKVWDQYEDYLIYIAKPIGPAKEYIQQIVQQDELYQLILLEPHYKLSQQMKRPIIQNTYQYSDDDLTIVDWNSAFICSDDDSQDISDVIEFALIQLLELRYYDDQLDKRIGTLYKELHHTAPSIFNRRYQKLTEEASRLYVDLSEVVERIENSLKVVGDFYFAKIYRAAVERLRVADWQNSVDHKLKNLAETSQLYNNEITNKRGHWLEVVIIILIAIEVIPFLFELYMKYRN